jgi:hypothetical protein
VRPGRRRLAVVLGALAIAAFWLTRLSTTDPLIYYATVLIVGVCVYFVIVPIDSLIFEYGKRVSFTIQAKILSRSAAAVSRISTLIRRSVAGGRAVDQS